MKHSRDGILSRILGPLELEIMRILWNKQKATVQDVLDDLVRRAQKPYAYTTVMTVMSRLHSKGILSRQKNGKSYVYSSCVSPDGLIERTSYKTVKTLLDHYGDLAMAQFVNIISHSPEQLARLKQLIRELEDGKSMRSRKISARNEISGSNR
jgi:predicted transcriptional regulator